MGTFRKIIIIVFIFILGVGAGFYFGKSYEKYSCSLKQGKEIVYKENCQSGDGKTEKNISSEKKERVNTEIRLLKDYVNFIYLPPEEIGNSEAYVTKMKEELAKLNDNALKDKFYSTGETANKEKNILNFINFLFDKTLSDLSVL